MPQRPGFLSCRDLIDADAGGDADLSTLPPCPIARLRAAWAACTDAPIGPIHGNLGAGNLIATPENPALIDWDEARVDFRFLDEIGARPATPSEGSAHTALEIAVGWHREPDRARSRVTGFRPEIRARPLAKSAAGPI